MDPANFLNPYVLAYLLIIIAGQVVVAYGRRREHERREARRRAAGLPEGLILNTATRLETVRREASIEAVVLLITVLVASPSFTFPALDDLSPYSVTIFTQPAGQTCTVSNGGGTLAGANVTGVSVSC